MNSEAGWPESCCVPAFLEAAIKTLAPGAPSISRQQLALAVGVILPPHVANPWSLPVSDDPFEWGVRPRDVVTHFRELQELVLGAATMTLKIVPLNTIPFELYEDALREFIVADSVVALSFDFVELCRRTGRTIPVEGDRSRHVVRLTPHDSDPPSPITVASTDFGFDFSGNVWVFDDSGEMSGSEREVPWRDLVSSSRAIEGGFWVVSRT